MKASSYPFEAHRSLKALLTLSVGNGRGGSRCCVFAIFKSRPAVLERQIVEKFYFAIECSHPVYSFRLIPDKR
jgi:hypothetical protein